MDFVAYTIPHDAIWAEVPMENVRRLVDSVVNYKDEG